jgi:transposase-like protein
MYRRHNFEERLKIVSRLISGDPLESLCKELNIDRNMVYQWYLRYKKFSILKTIRGEIV